MSPELSKEITNKENGTRVHQRFVAVTGEETGRQGNASRSRRVEIDRRKKSGRAGERHKRYTGTVFARGLLSSPSSKV